VDKAAERISGYAREVEGHGIIWKVVYCDPNNRKWIEQVSTP